MRNASYVLAATVVAITIAGCGGSAVSNNASQSAVGGSTPTVALTNLASIGYIETAYLTGAGRDLGTTQVNMSLADYTDINGNVVSLPTGANISLFVGAYGGPQVLRTPVTFGTSTTSTIANTNPDSRLFRTFNLSFDSLVNSNASVAVGPLQTWVCTGGMQADQALADTLGTSLYGTGQAYPAYVRAFPGRFTNLTVRLDPNTLGVNTQNYTDPNTGTAYSSSNPRGVFESAQFASINFLDPSNPSFNGVLSDYLSFDISAMSTSAKPSLTLTGGGTAVGQRVFFSGDTYAMADSSTSGNFYQFTQDISGTNPYLPGTFSTNQLNNGYTLPSGSVAVLPGTYALNQIDPSDPSFLRKILSMEGMFSDSTKMINSSSSVQAITFPSSQDNNVQDLVLFKRAVTGANAGKIVDFYYGYIDFEAREFYLYPINTIVAATSSTSYHGTISPLSLYNASGAVTSSETSIRSGRFTLDTPLTWQDGTSTTVSTGTFIVYRK